jgi:uncharacterized protein YndB with AHSA1/START domain
VTRTVHDIAAPAEAIWDVLADAYCYHRWVVGAKEIRAADGSWPTPGSRFHHSVGWGPFELQDDTKSLEVQPHRRLVMEARGRPLGRAIVEFVLEPRGSRTRVTMDERVVSPRLLRWGNPLLAPLIRLRNAESLRRLEQLTQGAVP